jgi:hypothetical protein
MRRIQFHRPAEVRHRRDEIPALVGQQPEEHFDLAAPRRQLLRGRQLLRRRFKIAEPQVEQPKVRPRRRLPRRQFRRPREFHLGPLDVVDVHRGHPRVERRDHCPVLVGVQRVPAAAPAVGPIDEQASDQPDHDRRRHAEGDSTAAARGPTGFIYAFFHSV